MSSTPKPLRWEDTHKPILPGTPEMEAHLGVGYNGLTVKDAKAILAAVKENPVAYPIQEVRRAEAFLAAYAAKPKVVARREAMKLPARD